jgi:hypothetical protein
MGNPLNPYVWALYLDSPDGALAVSYFEGLPDYRARMQHEWLRYGVFDWMKAHEVDTEQPWAEERLSEEASQTVQAVEVFARRYPAQTPEQVELLLTDLVTSEQVQLSDDVEDTLTVSWAMEDVQLVSLGLYLAHPDVFVPYGFKEMDGVGLHQELLQIAGAFEIALPAVAAKKDELGRWLYLGHFSAALQEFRKRHSLSMSELLAFLYDFARTYVQSEPRDDLPAPRHAWLLVGGAKANGDYEVLEAMEPEDTTHWQGSLDMQRGDVCVMYVTSPVKVVHSLFRVMEDAYVDPFFHYKHAVQIGQQQRVPPLPLEALKADPVFGVSSHIRRNLQGTSGQLLSRAEYDAVLVLLAARGLDLTQVPRLPEQAEVDLADLSNERDVELQRVEPLLDRLGIPRDAWVRQLPVRMGVGDRVYPDYAIGVTGTHPELRVHALVEVKYRASGERAWREAFYQAKSYAMRLGAQAFLLAAADGLRLYQRKADDFQYEVREAFGWEGLDDQALLLLRRVMSAPR